MIVVYASYHNNIVEIVVVAPIMLVMPPLLNETGDLPNRRRGFYLHDQLGARFHPDPSILHRIRLSSTASGHS